MKVLVACEFSGVVRDAFIKRGHDAMSCDILPSEAPGPHHIGDVTELLNERFDLMIGHPPCTYLTNSGVKHLHTDITRWFKLFDAAEFFKFSHFSLGTAISGKFFQLATNAQKQGQWRRA